MLTVDEIKYRVENAFKPFRCVAEIWDYQFRLRFRVFDENDNPLVKMEDLIIGDLQNPGRLDEILEQVRGRLRERGFTMDC